MNAQKSTVEPLPDAQNVAGVISQFVAKAHARRAELEHTRTALWSEHKSLREAPPPKDALVAELR